MSLNLIILIGRLGKDPESRQSQNGNLVVRFPIATDRRGNNDDGPDWHNIVAFGKTAELCEKYLSKGRQVYLEGRINNGKYEKDGKTRYFTEIIAHSVQFLGNKDDQPADDSPSRGGGSGSASSGSASSGGGFGGGFDDSEIPF